MARTKRDPNAICDWKMDGNDYFESEKWDTTCGEAYVFLEGGPVENGLRYCCYCGHRLRAVKVPEVADA